MKSAQQQLSRLDKLRGEAAQRQVGRKRSSGEIVQWRKTKPNQSARPKPRPLTGPRPLSD